MTALLAIKTRTSSVTVALTPVISASSMKTATSRSKRTRSSRRSAV
jgi:hypothetical protein